MRCFFFYPTKSITIKRVGHQMKILLKRTFTFITRFGVFSSDDCVISTFFAFVEFHCLGVGNNASNIRFAFAFLVAGSGKSSN